jgi:hypothetical protein
LHAPKLARDFHGREGAGSPILTKSSRAVSHCFALHAIQQYLDFAYIINKQQVIK